ncbi:type I-E CRISPR-associated protein Cse1/CasA [Microbacterium sp. ARD32]|uniref:type I-E CRISPR-associated protein Cse1/CasA n=1 Tax=Microbacterium sp. ARD32 TaxID=2962577 RepID=UPI002880FB2A|nr:type I-E CRISPR-associated protein Cse1/CasA [Microbacterium sp. ARD32]MDT0157643.1 type I-E CRISPR-associated protein Cse1/CasA [Microbacterium sp. ARD32]
MDQTHASESFDLLKAPWVLVRFLDGSDGEVSIREAFRQADSIREIVGELPTQSFGILRLLLAIIYRAHEDAITVDTWTHWHRDGLPLADIDVYLNDHQDRFNLFDDQRPFFQVADLATAKGERKDVGPLIADLPSNNRLFTNRAGEGAESLSFAEAARWLVHAQAYDISGIKSGAIGDPRVKGGKGYPIGTGFCGLLGGVYAQGRTLRETLLLNLVPQGSTADRDLIADIPPWEEEEPDGAAERPGLIPCGPVRLYTWQARRVRLFSEVDRVVACLVANGDKLTPQNMQTWEPLSAWRFSEPQTKAAKQTTFMPREHLPGRSLWRGIGALLPGIAPVVPKRDVPSGLAPGVVDWLARLDDAGVLEPSMRIRLRAVGMVYGPQSSVVAEVIDDQVLLPLSLLRERNRPLARQAEEAVRLADDGVRAVRRLAENLEKAAGGNGESRAPWAMESAWAALDAPYRAWLLSLGDDSDALDAIATWKSTAYGVLRAVGAELVAQAGPTAWVGREVSRLGQTELITTPRAEGWFLSALSKTFGSLARKDAAA